jgi:5,10-methylenetetrahydrofolate reductase
MSAWIDLHHALRRLARDDLFVFLTDNAVGAAEEENLAHVGASVADEVDVRRIVPILTCKHTLDYCLMFASRAAAQGYDALTVLGGDRSVGPPRCVPHASDLRELIRPRTPGLALGGWVNPLKDAETQVGFLAAPEAHADFALAQVVSHHALPQVERFLGAMRRSGLDTPIMFGVFYYRSANPKTLRTLGDFFPVPAEEITREFAEGADADEICARTIRELRHVGAEKIYVSNLGSRGAGKKLAKVLERV